MKFQVPAIISKITTMADKSLRLQVDTQELPKEEKAKVFDLHEEFGWFVFSKSDIKEDHLKDLPELKPEFKDQKSPSQLLRNRLYVYYEKTHVNLGDFDSWYKTEMNRIGQHYLDKLET